MDQPSDDDDDGRNNSAALLGLLAAVILVGLAVWLLFALKRGTLMEDCLGQGRHDCAPIDRAGAQ